MRDRDKFMNTSMLTFLLALLVYWHVDLLLDRNPLNHLDHLRLLLLLVHVAVAIATVLSVAVLWRIPSSASPVPSSSSVHILPLWSILLQSPAVPHLPRFPGLLNCIPGRSSPRRRHRRCLLVIIVMLFSVICQVVVSSV